MKKILVHPLGLEANNEDFLFINFIKYKCTAIIIDFLLIYSVVFF